MERTILITGSHGLIGTIIRPALAKYDHGLVLLDKNNPDNPVDLLNDKIDRYLRGIDTVIHLAANPDPFIDEKQADKNIEITKRVISACENSNIERIVNASSINVYPYYDLFSKGEKITYAIRSNPNITFGKRVTKGYYGTAKILSESLLKQFCRDKSLSLINLRFGCVTEDNSLPRQEDESIDPVDREIFLLHEDLKKIILKAVDYKGIGSYVCVSKNGGLVDESIRFPI